MNGIYKIGSTEVLGSLRNHYDLIISKLCLSFGVVYLESQCMSSDTIAVLIDHIGNLFLDIGLEKVLSGDVCVDLYVFKIYFHINSQKVYKQYRNLR